MGTPQAVAVTEEFVGIERFVTDKVISPAVEFLGAALDDGVDGAAGGAPVFSLIVGEEYLNFGDGVDRRREVGAAHRTGVERRDAVESEVDRALAVAVDSDATEVIPARGIAVGGIDDAGEQFDQAEVVAALEGDVLSLFERDEAAAFCGLCLQACGLGGDFNGLRNLAELEVDALEYNALGGGEDDCGLLVAFEAF